MSLYAHGKVRIFIQGLLKIFLVEISPYLCSGTFSCMSSMECKYARAVHTFSSRNFMVAFAKDIISAVLQSYVPRLSVLCLEKQTVYGLQQTHLKTKRLSLVIHV